MLSGTLSLIVSWVPRKGVNSLSVHFWFVVDLEIT